MIRKLFLLILFFAFSIIYVNAYVPTDKDKSILLEVDDVIENAYKKSPEKLPDVSYKIKNILEKLNRNGKTFYLLNQFKLKIDIKVTQGTLALHANGDNHYNSMDYIKAIEEFKKVIVLNPYDYEAYSKMGDNYYKLKEYDKALLIYDKAVELNSNYRPAYVGKGNTYYKFKLYEESVLEYSTAINFYPSKNTIRFRGNAYQNLGKDYLSCLDAKSLNDLGDSSNLNNLRALGLCD